MRALQLANFTTELLLDDDDQIRAALAELPGIDADAIVEHLDAAEVVEAYERDKAEARSAAGTAIEAQGKAATTELGLVRYTAPSVIFERDGQRLVAGGWQPELAYDLCIANLDPTLTRTPPPETAAPLLERFPDGLTTAEVAAARSPPAPTTSPTTAHGRAAAAETRRERRGRPRPARERSALANDAKTPSNPWPRQPEPLAPGL